MTTQQMTNLLAAALLTLTLGGGAQAAEDEKVGGGKFTTWVEFASDYVFRGESETNDGKIPSLKGQLTWTHDTGFFVAFYMANNLFPGGSEETKFNNPNINAIYGPSIGYAARDIGGTGIGYNGYFFQYIYPADNTSNYLEMFNYVDKQIGIVNLKLELSPTLTEWFGIEDLMSFNYAGHVAVSLPLQFTLSGSVGYQDFDYSGDAGFEDEESLDWTHWNVGISRPVWGFDLDLRYHDTDIDGFHAFYGTNTESNQIVDSRFVVALSKTF